MEILYTIKNIRVNSVKRFENITKTKYKPQALKKSIFKQHIQYKYTFFNLCRNSETLYPTA